MRVRGITTAICGVAVIWQPPDLVSLAAAEAETVRRRL
jgi:hypothetical protein